MMDPISLLTTLVHCIVCLCLLLAPTILIIRLANALKLRKLRQKLPKHDEDCEPRIIGFFHPFCDAMGGGEKVLFQALNAI